MNGSPPWQALKDGLQQPDKTATIATEEIQKAP